MQSDMHSVQSKRLILIGIALVLLLSIISITIVVVSRRSFPQGDTQASDGIGIAGNLLSTTNISWDNYTHPEGFSVDTPRGWTASELIEGQTTILMWESPDRSVTITLLLFPADVALDMDTPAGSPTISSVTVDGIQTQKITGNAGNRSVIYVGPFIRNNQGTMFSLTSTVNNADFILDRMTSSFTSFR